MWNLDVRKVSTAVTSVQDDLGLVLHFQLTLDLLQSSAIQEGYKLSLTSRAWVMKPSSPTTNKSESRSILPKTLESLHLINVADDKPKTSVSYAMGRLFKDLLQRNLSFSEIRELNLKLFQPTNERIVFLFHSEDKPWLQGPLAPAGPALCSPSPFGPRSPGGYPFP